MKKRLLILGAIAVMTMMSITGCGKKEVNLAKEAGVVSYGTQDGYGDELIYKINVFDFVDVKFVGPNGCGTYEVDTTRLSEYILKHTTYSEGSVYYEAIKENLNELFDINGVEMQNTDRYDVEGYLTNGDKVQVVMYNYAGDIGLPDEGWLKHSKVIIDDEQATKEFTVSGLEKISDANIWEGVGYEFEEKYSGWRISLVVDNEFAALDYEWDVSDTYGIENGDTFTVTAILNGETVGTKTFTVENKPE